METGMIEAIRSATDLIRFMDAVWDIEHGWDGYDRYHDARATGIKCGAVFKFGDGEGSTYEMPDGSRYVVGGKGNWIRPKSKHHHYGKMKKAH
jgi:hypothetical protein